MCQSTDHDNDRAKNTVGNLNDLHKQRNRKNTDCQQRHISQIHRSDQPPGQFRVLTLKRQHSYNRLYLPIRRTRTRCASKYFLSDIGRIFLRTPGPLFPGYLFAPIDFSTSSKPFLVFSRKVRTSSL